MSEIFIAVQEDLNQLISLCAAGCVIEKDYNDSGDFVQGLDITLTVLQMKLKFYFCLKDQNLSIAIPESPLDASAVEELITQMNSTLSKVVFKDNSLMKKVKSALAVFNDFMAKHGKSIDQNSTLKEMEINAEANPIALCHDGNVDKPCMPKQKKLVLAAVFTKPLKMPSQQDKPSEKKSSMRTAEQVIKRIKWDDSLDRADFTVGYEDRFIGTVERDFSEFDWDSDLSSVGPEVLAIPQHRIQYFKYHDLIVWNKNTRVDDFFGSTGSGKTIRDIIKQKVASAAAENISVTRQSPAHCSYSAGSDREMASHATGQQYKKTLASVPSSSKWRKQENMSRPNYFVCVRVDSTEVQNKVLKYVEKLSSMIQSPEHVETFSNSLISHNKLHVTLCVCHLTTDADVEKVKEVMDNTYTETEVINMAFQGVDNFEKSVIFVKPKCNSLYGLNRRLMEGLKEKGVILDGNFYPYKPHATFMQLPRRNKEVYSKISGFVEGRKSNQWDFGVQRNVSSVHLCKIGGGYKNVAEDGFYRIVASSLIKYVPSENTKEYPDVQNNSQALHVHKMQARASESPRRKNKKQYQRTKQEQAQKPDQFREKRDVRIGKALSAVLRHNKFGFKVDSGGYVDLETILKHQHFRKSFSATKEDIYRIVENNDKKRFTIDKDDFGNEVIKANQGHSVEVEDLVLTQITNAADYPTVVHGSFWKVWSSIQRQGLHRRKRIHIHLTTAEPGDGNAVISGMRKSCTVFVYVDMASALQDGIKFFVSSNGVILTPGNADGYLKPKYFLKVIGLTNGTRRNLLKEASTQATTECFRQQEDDTANNVLASRVSTFTSYNDVAREDLVSEEVDTTTESLMTGHKLLTEDSDSKLPVEESATCLREKEDRAVKDSRTSSTSSNNAICDQVVTEDPDVLLKSLDIKQIDGVSVNKECVVEDYRDATDDLLHTGCKLFDEDSDAEVPVEESAACLEQQEDETVNEALSCTGPTSSNVVACGDVVVVNPDPLKNILERNEKCEIIMDLQHSSGDAPKEEDVVVTENVLNNGLLPAADSQSAQNEIIGSELDVNSVMYKEEKTVSESTSDFVDGGGIDTHENS